MGATNEIKGTNITIKLAGLDCSQCLQKFTEQEIEEKNFELWFDTSNDVKLVAMEDLKEHDYYFPTGRKGYQLTIWIRSIEHQDCPETETCEGCWAKCLSKQIQEYKESFYCPTCYYMKVKDHA